MRRMVEIRRGFFTSMSSRRCGDSMVGLVVDVLPSARKIDDTSFTITKLWTFTFTECSNSLANLNFLQCHRKYYILSQIRSSITLDSHLTTYVPQAVNNARYLFAISDFPEIRYGCFFIISHRKDLKFFKSSIWKRKKSEVAKTSEQSGLEPETILSLRAFREERPWWAS